MIEKNKLNDLQKNAIEKIDNLLLNVECSLEYSEKAFYLNSEINYEVVLAYSIERFLLKFWLYFDQLEYAIFNEANTELSHCIIEDYAGIDEMLDSFFNYLLDDLEIHKVFEKATRPH